MFGVTLTLECSAFPRLSRLLSPQQGQVEQRAGPGTPGIATAQRPLEALLPLPQEERHIML